MRPQLLQVASVKLTFPLNRFRFAEWSGCRCSKLEAKSLFVKKKTLEQLAIRVPAVCVFLLAIYISDLCGYVVSHMEKPGAVGGQGRLDT
jgi:hypothetical protein